MVKVGFSGEHAGHRAQVTVQFRGRELAHMDVGLNLVKTIIERLSDVAKVEQMPRRDGRRMVAILVPK